MSIKKRGREREREREGGREKGREGERDGERDRQKERGRGRVWLRRKDNMPQEDEMCYTVICGVDIGEWQQRAEDQR